MIYIQKVHILWVDSLVNFHKLTVTMEPVFRRRSKTFLAARSTPLPVTSSGDASLAKGDHYLWTAQICFFLFFIIYIYIYLFIYVCVCVCVCVCVIIQGLPGGVSGKELAYQCRRHEKLGFDSWVRKILWRRAWRPAPVFLPVESQRQRSPAGYSP